MTTIAASAIAMSAIAASAIAMSAIAASAIARDAIVANSTAKTALNSSPLAVSSGQVNGYNGNYTSVYTKACYIIKAVHNYSGWTCGMRYLYTTGTTTTTKTWTSATSAWTVGQFASSLAAMSNANSSSSGRITITYIPC